MKLKNFFDEDKNIIVTILFFSIFLATMILIFYPSLIAEVKYKNTTLSDTDKSLINQGVGIKDIKTGEVISIVNYTKLIQYDKANKQTLINNESIIYNIN